MRILCDFHHDCLFYSLQFLFEKRLGWEMYRPMGMDWYYQGYWHIYPHPDTANQFLGLDQATNRPKDLFGNYLTDALCLNKNYREEDGIFYITNSTKPDNIQRGILLDKFKETEFDAILSSIPAHIGPFNRLISQFQPRAKHIFQVGNAWGHQPGVKNILSSTAPFSIPNGVNACFYHQEFDLNWFHYEPPQERETLYSYIHWMRDKDFFDGLKQMLPSWKVKSFGAGMDDTIVYTQDVAKQMISSAFTWHWKPEGDGYGHVLFDSYACGRPALINKNHYRGKLGEQLLEDRKTCIDIGGKTQYEVVSLLNHYSQPEEHDKLCQNAHKRFQDVVNFDHEYQHILKPFIERLI